MELNRGKTGDVLKRILLFLAAAAAGLGPVFAQDLPGLQTFLSDLPVQAVPAPHSPLKVKGSYLSQTSGLYGEKLFQYLHRATEYNKDRGSTTYLKAKRYMFSVADNTGCGGRPGVTAFYSQVCVHGDSDNGGDYREPGDANDDGYVDRNGMNAEHVWPQGFFDQKLPMRADLHHLFPTFIKPNNVRGTSPFGYADYARYSTSSGSMFDGDVFEPTDCVKGDVARALLYFVVRYYDRRIRDGADYGDFWVNRVALLMAWNRQDPPDSAERRRNDLIEDYQGNRNPFVDDHYLAERVGERVFQSH